MKANHGFTSVWGFTLFETMLYVGLLAIVVIFVTSFFLAIVRLNTHVELTGEVLDNAKRAIDIIDQEIRLSTSVYTPTSVFGASPGQMSLETTQQLPSGENSTYVDFYIDDGRLYMKREGQSPELLISKDVRITNFTLTYLIDNTSQSQEAVRVDITAAYGMFSNTDVRFFTTSSFRSY